MRYLSVCSGIEAVTAAWEPLGWEPAAFAEIARFPSAVLAHRWPQVRNLGDFTAIPAPVLNELGPVRLLVGGTPCQSFSVAGLRQGLRDPRGNLALAFLALADRLRPRWIIWENVPGVLSSRGGRDFGTFLGALGELGYGWAYRVLDAQFFGVPQRRRRVFVVGHLGDNEPAAEVLFEPEGVQGHSPPRRQAGAGVAGTLEARAGSGGYDPGAHGAAGGHLVPSWLEAYGGGVTKGAIETCPTLTASGLQLDFDTEPFVAHTLRAGGFDASEDGTGRGTPLVPVTLRGSGHTTGGVPFLACPTIAVQERAESEGTGGPCGKAWKEEIAYTMEARHRSQSVLRHGAVRRITPREAERLQGFQDDHTLIPGDWRPRKAADLAETILYYARHYAAWVKSWDGALTLAKETVNCPDGPRYHAIGNSMAVLVVRWLGQRIAFVHARRGFADA